MRLLTLKPVLGLLLLALSASGCGPVVASTAVGRAEAAIKKAEKVKAHELAPYSYWLADSYLRKAKLTEGYSEFAASERFANQAAHFAEECVEEAEREKDRLKLRDMRTRGRVVPQKKKRRKKRRKKPPTKGKREGRR